MTHISIQEQIAAIQNATDKAIKSKETAKKFLVEAGIIKEKINESNIEKNKK